MDCPINRVGELLRGSGAATFPSMRQRHNRATRIESDTAGTGSRTQPAA